jgi:uncharacterized integral membrane protein (TIGR00698 family)
MTGSWPASAALLAARWRDDIHGLWPGVLLSIIIAVASTFVADHRGGPTLLYALLLGMALNTVAVEGIARHGVDFVARRVLRFGVALLGARITLDQVGTLGAYNAVVLVAAVVATIAFGAWLSRRLGLSRRIGLLTGGATAICGASAALAIAAVLPRDESSERELVFTIAGVTFLSTAAMIAYPVVVSLAGLDAVRSGIFLGGTIHDVAQVVGAGYSISPEVGDYAVLTKMLRVALLLPVVMTIAVVIRRGRAQGEQARTDPLLPPFLLAFVVLVVAGSVGAIPKTVAGALNDVSRACLVVAIAAVGLKTSVSEMRKVGARAIALLGIEALCLAAILLASQRLH